MGHHVVLSRVAFVGEECVSLEGLPITARHSAGPCLTHGIQIPPNTGVQLVANGVSRRVDLKLCGVVKQVEYLNLCHARCDYTFMQQGEAVFWCGVVHHPVVDDCHCAST
jgi:protein-tyrosine phosphatase